MAKAAKKKAETIETPVASTEEAPSFNLNADSLDYTDDAQLNADLEKSGGKYFDEPGNVDLAVIAADFHKNKEKFQYLEASHVSPKKNCSIFESDAVNAEMIK